MQSSASYYSNNRKCLKMCNVHKNTHCGRSKWRMMPWGPFEDIQTLFKDDWPLSYSHLSCWWSTTYSWKAIYIWQITHCGKAHWSSVFGCNMFMSNRPHPQESVNQVTLSWAILFERCFTNWVWLIKPITKKWHEIKIGIVFRLIQVCNEPNLEWKIDGISTIRGEKSV